MSVIFSINGGEVEPPINLESLRIQINNDTEDPDAKFTVTVDDVTFTVDGSKIINQYIEDGENGGTGIFEGLPADMILREGGQSLPLINGYLDLAASNAEFECDIVTATLVKKGSNDWFKKASSILTFPFLAEEIGSITSADFIFIPYINSSIPDTKGIAIVALTGFTVGMQIRTITKDLIEFIAKIGGVFTTIPALINLFLYIGFLIFFIFALLKLIRQLIDLIIQPVKYQAGMRLQTLLEKGAEHLNHTFESSFFDDPFWKDVVIIPSKFQSFDDGNEKGILGFIRPTPTQQTGYFEGTFGELLTIFEDMRNARHLVNDGVIRVERIDKDTSDHNFIIPAVEILSQKFNADELKSNYNISFLTDLSDENTLNEYEGTKTGITTEPERIENADMVLMDGIKEVNIPFALGKRKTTLTKPELFFNAIIKAICLLVELVSRSAPRGLGGILRIIPAAGICNLLENRIGMLSLSADYFQVPKIVAFDIDEKSPVNTKVKSSKAEGADKDSPGGSNSAVLNAESLWNTDHFINSFVPSKKLPEPNQWRKYITPSPIKFCLVDLIKVINNKLIFDTDGVRGKLISLEYNPELQEATIEYWLQQIYSTNLKESIHTPDGK